MMLVSLIFLGSFFLLPFLEKYTWLSKAAVFAQKRKISPEGCVDPGVKGSFT